MHTKDQITVFNLKDETEKAVLAFDADEDIQIVGTSFSSKWDQIRIITHSKTKNLVSFFDLYMNENATTFTQVKNEFKSETVPNIFGHNFENSA